MSTICCCDPSCPNVVSAQTSNGETFVTWPGVTVTATRSGFATVTCVTAISGVSAACSLSLAPGVWSVTASHPRANSFTRTVTVATNCAFQVQTFPLTAATGYKSVGGCAVPLPDTLHATTPLGSVTLTRSGGTWFGSVGVSMTAGVPGVGTCVLASGTDTVSINFSFIPTSRTSPFFGIGCAGTANGVSCSPHGDSWVATHCTSNGVGTGAGGSFTCPTSFLYTGTLGGTWTDNATGNTGTALYSGSFTVTE